METPTKEVAMLKKIAVLAIAGFVAKLVLNKLTGKSDADLWAEATDKVR
jgi:hypothetical protein